MKEKFDWLNSIYLNCNSTILYSLQCTHSIEMRGKNSWRKKAIFHLLSTIYIMRIRIFALKIIFAFMRVTNVRINSTENILNERTIPTLNLIQPNNYGNNVIIHCTIKWAYMRYTCLCYNKHISNCSTMKLANSQLRNMRNNTHSLLCLRIIPFDWRRTVKSILFFFGGVFAPNRI